MLLLNPQAVSADGEWETIFFANWIPGNQRYRTFRDDLADQVATEEMLEIMRSERQA